MRSDFPIVVLPGARAFVNVRVDLGVGVIVAIFSLVRQTMNITQQRRTSRPRIVSADAGCKSCPLISSLDALLINEKAYERKLSRSTREHTHTLSFDKSQSTRERTRVRSPQESVQPYTLDQQESVRGYTLLSCTLSRSMREHNLVHY